MARWEPDARERLQQAALELFVARGFAQTTVPEITAHAGLTTRTFFRYFADKREVLFDGEDEIAARAGALLASAPPGTAPVDVVEHCLSALADEIFEPRRASLRTRRALVASDETLRERELHKQAALVEVAAAGLRERGLDSQTAALLARVAAAALQVAVGRWLEQDAPDRRLADHVRGSLDLLRGALDRPPAERRPGPPAGVAVTD